jgi:hypothetical protein
MVVKVVSRWLHSSYHPKLLIFIGVKWRWLEWLLIFTIKIYLYKHTHTHTSCCKEFTDILKKGTTLTTQKPTCS